MKRTVSPITSRLWTCSDDARALLQRGVSSPDELSGVLLQHARVAESVTKAGDGENRVRRFRISTETRDRHGDVVRSRGIMLKNYRKNPVVLFGHQSFMPPIGTSPKVEIGDGVVDADVSFFDRETYDFADTIFRIVEAGGLKATSIGFIPTKYERLEVEDPEKDRGGWDFKKSDLLEFSIVPIPANPEAVGRVAKDGASMGEYVKWLEDMQDNRKTTHPLLMELGLEDNYLLQVQKAASGEPVSVSVYDDIATLLELDEDESAEDESEEEGELEEEEEELEGEDDPDEEEESIESLQVQSEELVDGTKVIRLLGDGFPKRTVIAAALVEDADQTILRKEDDDTIIIDLDEQTAIYEIVENDANGDFVCSLVSVTDKDKAAISYGKAHPNGTPAQPKDAAWNASAELRAATVPTLQVMCAWRESKPAADLVKGDFKFPHHKAAGEHAVNFRACAAGVAVLNGGRGGANIPSADKKPVWNHLARHFRDDFDTDPPELRWLEIEPLKNFPDQFFFNYSGAQLLVKDVEEDGEIFFVDAKEAFPVLEDGEDTPTFKIKSDKNAWVIHSIAGRKNQWASLEEFLEWAKEEGFDTTDPKETRRAWNLAQDDETRSDGITISLYPNDVEPGSQDCQVQATLIPRQQDEENDRTSGDRATSFDLDLRVNRFVLAGQNGVRFLDANEQLDDPSDESAAWALMVAEGGCVSGFELEAATAEQADKAIRAMAGAFGRKTLHLASLTGLAEDGPAYSQYAMYRKDEHGVIRREALCDTATDLVQGLLDDIEGLSARDLSEDDLSRLVGAKNKLDALLEEEEDEEDEGDALLELLSGGDEGVTSSLSELFAEIGQETASSLVDKELKKLTGEVD